MENYAKIQERLDEVQIIIKKMRQKQHAIESP